MSYSKDVGGQRYGAGRAQDLTNANTATLFGGTGVNTRVLPNQARDTSGDEQGNSGSGEHKSLADAIKSMGDGTIAKVSVRLAARLAPAKAGTDNVLRNLQGADSSVRGTMIPVAYNRSYNKEFMGQPQSQRRTVDAPEIAGRMALARMNRADPGVLARAIV